MKSVAYWALLPSLLTASSALAAFSIVDIKKTTNLPTVLNKFIIEVEELPSIPNRRSFTRSLDAIYSSLNERAVEYEITKEFDTEGIFTGAALVVTDAKDAVAIENTPGVKAIRPIRKFKQPRVFKDHVITGPDDPEIPPAPFSTHVLGGVDKVHAEGNIGRGIKIGILDTGIDYNHPDLGEGYGPAFKVIGGYDFVGDAYTGENTPIPDSDPMDCQGHGTHVAGIVSANPGNPYNITGVAYGASIAAYRVFGCEGSVTEDVLVDALLRGFKDGMDILTLSLGGADGWAASSSAVVASRIAASGKIVTIAAGNDGSSGSWYSSSPGNAFDAISVASIENTVVPLQNATVHGVVHDPITYFSSLPFPVEEVLPIYAISNDTTIPDDACYPLPEGTPDLSPYLVIVRRGTCAFTQKLGNIAAKGGKVTLIYDNGNGFSAISVGDYLATLIQAADGEFLVEQFAAGVPVSISFPQVGGATNYPDPNGGLMSSFSTYGPSNDFHFKPAIAAPGGNVISTIPRNQGAYGVKSGTSMATPYIAGTAALLLAAKGTSRSVARNARTLFETTANKILTGKTDGDLLQTVTQAGAGLVNIYKAIHTTTIVSPGELILNDTAHYQRFHTFTVENKGSTAKRYKLTHAPAGTALTGSTYPALGPVPLSPASATVRLSPETFTVRPGQTQTVVAVFSPPAGLDASRYPVYSGFIDVTSGSESHHVSYLGLLGSLKDKQVVDNTEEYFGFKLPAVLDAAGDPQVAPTNYTFVDGDFPSLLWRLVFGTPTLRVDLVDSAIKFTPTLESRGLHWGPFFTFPHAHNGGSFARVKIVGPLSSFDYITRHDEDSNGGNAWTVFNLETPTFANGTAIPSGSYRVLMRALRVTGNPKREEDYESWLSPIIGIQPF